MISVYIQFSLLFLLSRTYGETNGFRCEPNPVCILSYSLVNFDNFKILVGEISSLTNFIKWSDNSLKNWLSRLQNWCVGFNAGTKCTGNRWWNCASDLYLQGVSNLSFNQSKLPYSLEEMKEIFESMADICEPSLTTSIERNHVCMRNAFASSNLVDLKQQISDAEYQSLKNCKQFDCDSSKLYFHFVVYIVRQFCSPNNLYQNAHSAAMSLFHPLLRLDLLQKQKTICSSEEFPRNSTDYEKAPEINMLSVMKATNNSSVECYPMNLTPTIPSINRNRDLPTISKSSISPTPSETKQTTTATTTTRNNRQTSKVQVTTTVKSQNLSSRATSRSTTSPATTTQLKSSITSTQPSTRLEESTIAHSICYLSPTAQIFCLTTLTRINWNLAIEFFRNLTSPDPTSRLIARQNQERVLEQSCPSMDTVFNCVENFGSSRYFWHCMTDDSLQNYLLTLGRFTGLDTTSLGNSQQVRLLLDNLAAKCEDRNPVPTTELTTTAKPSSSECTLEKHFTHCFIGYIYFDVDLIYSFIDLGTFITWDNSQVENFKTNLAESCRYFDIAASCFARKGFQSWWSERCLSDKELEEKIPVLETYNSAMVENLPQLSNFRRRMEKIEQICNTDIISYHDCLNKWVDNENLTFENLQIHKLTNISKGQCFQLDCEAKEKLLNLLHASKNCEKIFFNWPEIIFENSICNSIFVTNETSYNDDRDDFEFSLLKMDCLKMEPIGNTTAEGTSKSIARRLEYNVEFLNLIAVIVYFVQKLF